VSAVEAVWLRRPRSGARHTQEILVRVVGYTPAGALIIERERRGRMVRETVANRNVKAIES
jgi:hypothetical protein